MIDYQQELQARLDKLTALLSKVTLRGGEESLRLYQRYVNSDYQTLPYAGGWLDQPVWWTEDVKLLELFGEKYWIPNEIKRVEDALKEIAKR